MNYLALTKRLRLEAALSGTGPASVVGQTGEMGRLVEWIAAGYNDIQTAHATWRFLRSDFSFSTIASTQTYTPAAVSITDLAEWIRESVSLYSSVADECFLEYIPWEEFRSGYLLGTNRSTEGRPSAVTVKPDNSLTFWQIPNAVFTVNGEYFQTPDVMTVADASEPNFPARFHMAIVWKALMYYGAYAAADEKYTHGEREYNRLMAQLEFDQLAKLSWGEPLV